MSSRPIEGLGWIADTEATLIRPTETQAEGHGVLRLNQIQEQVGRGEYRVDTKAVADAILRRLLRGNPVLVGSKNTQEECS